MANFNTNSWYQLTLGSSKDQSFDGTPLYDHGKGAVFFQTTNTTKKEQQWQIFPFNSSYYVLRTKGSGPIGYMQVAVSSTAELPGNTVGVVRNVTLSDASMFWEIKPWEDGTFYFANAANGSAWHLTSKPNSLIAMSSNITAPQNGQRFAFTELGRIDDVRFSSVQTPSVTNAPTGTASNLPADSTPTETNSITPTPSATSSSKSGLSTGAKAGIGASIGGAALLVLIALAIFFMRRRKRLLTEKKTESARVNAWEEDQKKQMLPPQGEEPQELFSGTKAPRHEMEVPPSELGNGDLRAELGSENYAR